MLGVMIKRLFGIITFLALSLFLIMPVSAADEFTKTTPVEIEDLDYRNSLVDWKGLNVEIEIYWDKRGGLSPDAAYIILYQNYVISVNVDVWNYDAETEMYLAYLDETSKRNILSVLFSRSLNLGNVLILGGATQGEDYMFEVRINFKSLLNTNFGSFYSIDRFTGTNEIDINYIDKIVNFGLKNGDLVGGILLDDMTGQGYNTTQQALYNFVDKYTNIKSIYLSYIQSKKDTGYLSGTSVFIYQLGFFADSQVILPELDIDADFQIYAPTICGILNLACVSRNLIGEFSNTLYKSLGAESMAGGVMDIYDTLFYPVYIINNAAWQNGILSIYLMLTIGVLYLIVKRVIT